VFLADLKGDLTGLAEPGPGNEHIDARMSGMGLPWHPASFPVELLSISGRSGTPLRVPVSSFGPLLLAKVLDCTDTQESVLQVIFKYADESGLALLDLVDLVELLRYLTSADGGEVQGDDGGTPTVPTRLVAPVSLMDPVDAATVERLVAASPLRERYATRIDRESAAASVGREVGRSLVRGILGNLGR
jgi:hypothetical protein